MPARWDTSAIIHVCVPAPNASAARRVLSQHAAVWWTARVKVRSVLERSRRERVISPRAYAASRNRLETLLGSWREILPTDSLRELACVQLERLPIRAADLITETRFVTLLSRHDDRQRGFPSHRLCVHHRRKGEVRGVNQSRTLPDRNRIRKRVSGQNAFAALRRTNRLQSTR